VNLHSVCRYDFASFWSVIAVVSRRKKRDTSSADERVEDALPANAIDPNEEGEVPGPEGLHPNATWPTPSNITLELATNSCVTPIQSLAIYNVCAEYTALTSPAIVDSCILDIQVHRPLFSIHAIT